MQIGFDVGATKIESVVLEDTGQESFRERTDCPKEYDSIISNIVEITRCEDCGPGTKLLGSLKKLKKNSTIILADDDQIYEDYMIEAWFAFQAKEWDIAAQLFKNGLDQNYSN